MTKVLDDETIARAFRAAESRLAARDPDILAGRFSPVRPEPKATASPKEPALAGAESGRKRAV